MELESLKIKYLFDYIFNLKNKEISKRENFYGTIFIHIIDLKSEGEYILNDLLFLKCLIRMIRTDEKFISICDDEKMKNIIKNNLNGIIEINEFKARN